MNNGNNVKLVGMELLKKIQVLYQNKAISTEEKNIMTAYVKEGMKEGTFYKLSQQLFDVLEHTSLPDVIEDMISIVF